jgi:hypothetical protein
MDCKPWEERERQVTALLLPDTTKPPSFIVMGAFAFYFTNKRKSIATSFLPHTSVLLR